jgi:hypothetical protein
METEKFDNEKPEKAVGLRCEAAASHFCPCGNCKPLCCRWHSPCETTVQNRFRKDKLMKFAVEIGEIERNRLEYYHNQLLGSMTIKVNDTPVKKVVRFVNEPVLEVYSFIIGNNEKTTVRIEKERLPLLGYRNRVYVNDRLMRVFKGV